MSELKCQHFAALLIILEFFT